MPFIKSEFFTENEIESVLRTMDVDSRKVLRGAIQVAPKRDSIDYDKICGQGVSMGDYFRGAWLPLVLLMAWCLAVYFLHSFAKWLDLKSAASFSLVQCLASEAAMDENLARWMNDQIRKNPNSTVQDVHDWAKIVKTARMTNIMQNLDVGLGESCEYNDRSELFGN